MDRGWIVLSVVVVCGCGMSRKEKASEGDCRELRSHLIELQVATAPAIDSAPHRIALERALGDGFLNECTSRYTADQAKCAMTSKSVIEADACVHH